MRKKCGLKKSYIVGGEKNKNSGEGKEEENGKGDISVEKKWKSKEIK